MSLSVFQDFYEFQVLEIFNFRKKHGIEVPETVFLQLKETHLHFRQYEWMED